MSKIIHLNEILPCGKESAFQYFSQSNKLVEWLCEDAMVELKVGGKYELYWDSNNKLENSTIGCVITSLQQPDFICFDWKGPVQYAHFMNDSDPLTHVSIHFMAIDENHTEVHLFHTGWQTSAVWQEARNYFEVVWGKALNGLQSRLKK